MVHFYLSGCTVAWKSDPIGCQGSDPDVNQADALHVKNGLF